MKPHTLLQRCVQQSLIMLLAVAVLAAPVAGWRGAQTTGRATVAANPSAVLSVAERAASALLKVETVREVTNALAAPDMEGRGTAQPGGDRAAKYLADRFAKLGLKPLGDKGTYLQSINFKSTEVSSESSVKAGDATLKYGDEFIVPPPYVAEQSNARGGIVFAGYGVISKQLKRDDFEGLDVQGKFVLILQGQPKNVDAALWKQETGTRSAIINAFSRRAAGLIIANVDTPGQPYALAASYLTRRNVERAGSAADVPFKLPPIVVVSNGGAEKLFDGSGMSYAQTLEKAAGGEFVSRDLGKELTASIRIKKYEATSSNVVAVLDGSDPKLKDEAVIYTAHYDAYGIGSDGRIYPGAADNALGVAQIVSIAEAFAKSPARPRRSVIFLAVTGEEHGMLGAEYWVENPTWPLAKLAANLNFDGIGTEVYGPVKKVVGFGYEHSNLAAVLDGAVVANGAAMAPDPLPEEKAFYRSDHYEFVKKGIPALMLLGAPEGDSAAFIARMKKWLETDYHQPTDVVRPDWDWDGARTLAVIGLVTGMRVANADTMPAWLSTSPFNRPRGSTKPPPREP